MSEADFRSEDARAEAERSAAADESVTSATAGDVDDEAMRVAEGLTVSDDVRESYQEQVERSAHLEGEGRIP